MVCYGVMAGAWVGYFVYRSERGKLIECLHATPEKCVPIKNAATQNEPNRSLVCATFSQRKLLNRKKKFFDWHFIYTNQKNSIINTEIN